MSTLPHMLSLLLFQGLTCDPHWLPLLPPWMSPLAVPHVPPPIFSSAVDCSLATSGIQWQMHQSIHIMPLNCAPYLWTMFPVFMNEPRRSANVTKNWSRRRNGYPSMWLDLTSVLYVVLLPRSEYTLHAYCAWSEWCQTCDCWLPRCYARRTLVGRSGTRSSQGRYSWRDTTSLIKPEVLGRRYWGTKVSSRLLKDSRIRWIA